MSTQNKRRRDDDDGLDGTSEDTEPPHPSVPANHPFSQLVRPAGIAFLSSTEFQQALLKSAEMAFPTFNITPDAAIEEFRRFLALKAFVSDTDATILSPTLLMNFLWHTAVLDTRMYANLQEALGVVLHYHHRPSGACSAESLQREKRLAHMKALYEIYFECQPVEEARGFEHECARAKADDPGGEAYQIFIKVLGGATRTLGVSTNTSVRTVKLLIWEYTRIPPPEMRLIFAGKMLEDGRTISSYEILKESTLHLVLSLTGR